MERLIFHVDVNSAFLSWESARRVEEGESDLRLVPAVVGGDPASRTSIVAAGSIPAKQCGIRTGESMASAMKKCPGLIWVRADFELYRRCSRAFKEICRQYSPVVESFSIDEVFMDMTGMGRIYPDPVAAAHELKDTIRDRLGFTVNVGIGRCKLCAKMASDFQKPDRVHTLFPEEIPGKMWPLPVGDLFMVGKASADKLVMNGVRTIGDLAALPDFEACRILGEKTGRMARNFANGWDDSPVKEEREEAKGYSVETTLEEDLCSFPEAERLLRAQADVLSARIRREGVKCRCIGVTLRTPDFAKHSHQRKLSDSTDVTEEIYETACRLLHEFWSQEPVRLVGLSLTEIDRDGFEQMDLFPDERKEKQKKLDTALDSIRVRFGDGSVKRAGALGEDRLIGRRHRTGGEKKQQ